ncbi:MarR family transcriptional regulator [Actinokineospora sp. HUAS TT18]|uniref:MarR family transcriptional regulator n=1 Tax=Actinokineospora sp. HUAS TT18 TaxID=3447451 RepID=UPI003F52660A
MSSVPSGDARRRRRLVTGLRDGLRELSVQLTLLNSQVSGKLALRDADLQCLDLITRLGPLSPSAAAKRSGVHPATMTGILDRLERAGFIARDRDPDDRRSVLIRALPERGAEVYGLYAGMNSAMDAVLASYDEDQLTVIADFLRRTTAAGQAATDDLARGSAAER